MDRTRVNMTAEQARVAAETALGALSYAKSPFLLATFDRATLDALSTEDRQWVFDWLRENGVDPDGIPMDSGVALVPAESGNGQGIEYMKKVRRDTGALAIYSNEVLRVPAYTPVTVCLPEELRAALAEAHRASQAALDAARVAPRRSGSRLVSVGLTALWKQLTKQGDVHV